MNDLSPAEVDRLVQAAIEARHRAYAPHSNFSVGAAIWIQSDSQSDQPSPDNQIIRGCNVENASYSLTICAERVAATTAVANGFRNFHAIAIASTGGVSPCGACRQFLCEFGDLHVIMVDVLTAERQIRKLSQLLPDAFDGSNLPMH